MGWFDWFDDERVVQVAGGISRLRDDASVRSTTGLIVNSALLANQDIGEALRLNEITGTVSSFKKFNRISKASSTIGVPTTSFVYSTISKEQLAAAIRSNISQVYPVAADIEDEDVSSGTLSGADHSKYALQVNKAYNLTTNIFTHLGVDYYFDSYVDQFSGPTHTGYTITGTKVTTPFTTISFTLAVPKPAATVAKPAVDEFGSPITVYVPAAYWVVYYTYLARRYVWIADLTLQVFSESAVGVNVNNYPELEFAPIVTLRNDGTFVNSGTAFTEATKALQLIGLEPNAVNALITQSGVEDVYVSLFSNLITTHMDQLAYNYAFFEYMDGFGIINESLFDATNNALLGNSGIYPFNKLSISKSGVYSNDTSWGYIKKTTGIVGTLAEEYTYSLVDTGLTHWVLGVAVGDYTIRKRTSDSTYDEILVRNLSLTYTVFASEGDVKAFSVPVLPVSGAQAVIPFSYKIALSVPGRYRETLFLRCLHAGVFAKSVTEIPWYQQEWFSDLLLIGTIVYAIYSTDWTAVTTAIEAGAAAIVEEFWVQGIVISTSTATIILLSKYVIAQYVLRALLIKALQASDNSFLKAFVTIAFVYISIQMSGGNSLSTAKQVLMGGKATLEVGNILVQQNAQETMKGMQALQADKIAYEQKIQPLLDQIAVTEAKEAAATQALTILNMFRDAGEGFITEADIQRATDQRTNVDDQISMISQFVGNALKLLDPPTLILESETLLA